MYPLLPESCAARNALCSFLRFKFQKGIFSKKLQKTDILEMAILACIPAAGFYIEAHGTESRPRGIASGQSRQSTAASSLTRRWKSLGLSPVSGQMSLMPLAAQTALSLSCRCQTPMLGAQ